MRWLALLAFIHISAFADDRFVRVGQGENLPICPIVQSLMAGDADLGPFIAEYRESGSDATLQVLSDRLEESGHEGRANFLRAQGELGELLAKYHVVSVSELPPSEVSKGEALLKRVKDFKMAASAWATNLPHVKGYEFRNGVLDGAIIDVAVLMVATGGDPKRIEAYYRNLQALGIRKLELTSAVREVNWGLVTNLFVLNAGMTGFTSLSLPPEAASHFGRIVALRSRMGNLAKPNELLKNLEELDFHGQDLSSEMLFSLVRDGGMTRLKTLGNNFVERAVPQLVRGSTDVAGLERQRRALWDLNRFHFADLNALTDMAITIRPGIRSLRALPPNEVPAVIHAALASGDFRRKLLGSQFSEAAELYDLAAGDAAVQKEVVKAYQDYHPLPAELARVIEGNSSSAFAQAILTTPHEVTDAYLVPLRTIARGKPTTPESRKNFLAGPWAPEAKARYLLTRLEDPAFRLHFNQLVAEPGNQKGPLPLADLKAIREEMNKRSDFLTTWKIAVLGYTHTEEYQARLQELGLNSFIYDADSKNLPVTELKFDVVMGVRRNRPSLEWDYLTDADLRLYAIRMQQWKTKFGYE